MKTKVNYFAILVFYTIAISMRYITNKTHILEGVYTEFLKILLQAAGPAVGACVAFCFSKSKPVLSLRGNYNQIGVPFLLYWGLPITLILSVEYFSEGTLSFFAVSAILCYGLLEEIGWRGFLRQELKPLPPLLNILIVATLWFVWHLNFDMSASNLLFFGILILGSWGIGKVADNTRSLFAVSAFHSVNNFFPVMNNTKIILLGTLLAIWIVCLVVRKKRSRVMAPAVV